MPRRQQTKMKAKCITPSHASRRLWRSSRSDQRHKPQRRYRGDRRIASRRTDNNRKASAHLPSRNSMARLKHFPVIPPDPLHDVLTVTGTSNLLGIEGNHCGEVRWRGAMPVSCKVLPNNERLDAVSLRHPSLLGRKFARGNPPSKKPALSLIAMATP